MPDVLPAVTVPELIKEMTRARRPESETRVFALWRHDADLLPKLVSRLNSLMNAIKKHPADVYDVQGLRDEGTDVFVKRPGQPPVCFQVKSDSELDDKDIIDKLRLQFTRTLENYRPAEYYIVVCADYTGRGNAAEGNASGKRPVTAHARRKEEKKRAQQRKNIVRRINELARIEGVTVIQPANALGMLRLSDAHLDALVTGRFSSADSVFADVQACLRPLPRIQRALVARLAWERVFGSDSGKVNLEDLTRDTSLEECRRSDSQVGYLPYADGEWRVIVERAEDVGGQSDGEEDAFEEVLIGDKDVSSQLVLRDGELVGSSFVSSDGEGDSIAAALDALDGVYVRVSDDWVELEPWPASPVLALILDGVARYGHERASDAVEYVLSVV